MKLSGLPLHNKIKINTGLPASSSGAKNIFKAFANKDIPDKDYDRIFHLTAFLFTYYVPKIEDKKNREAAIGTINSFLTGSNILTNLTKFAKSNVKEQDRDAITTYINDKIVNAGLYNTLKPAESVAHAFAIIYEDENPLKDIQARENKQPSQTDTHSTIQNTNAYEQTLNNKSKNTNINHNENTTDKNNNEEPEINEEQLVTQSNSVSSNVNPDTTENIIQSSRINTLKKNFEPDQDQTFTSTNVTKESKITQPGTIVNKLKEQFEKRNKEVKNNSLSDAQINQSNIVVDETLVQRKAKLENNQTVSRPHSAASADSTRTINVGRVKKTANTFTSTVLNEHEKTVIERGKRLEAERLRKFQQAKEEKDKVSKLHINATQQAQNNKIEEAKQRRVDRETTVIDNRFHNLAQTAVARAIKDVPETFFASNPEQLRETLEALALSIQENNVDNKNIKMDVDLPSILKDILEIAIRKNTDKSRISGLLKKLNVAIKQPEVVSFLNQVSSFGQTTSSSNIDMLSAWLDIIKNHSLLPGEIEPETNPDVTHPEVYKAKTESFSLNENKFSVEFHSNEQEELDSSRLDAIENDNSTTPQDVKEEKVDNQEDLTSTNVNNPNLEIEMNNFDSHNDENSEIDNIDDKKNDNASVDSDISSVSNKTNSLNEGEEERESEYDSSVNSISSSNNSQYSDTGFDLDNLNDNYNLLKMQPLSQSIIQLWYNNFVSDLDAVQAKIGKSNFMDAYKQVSDDYQIINKNLLENIPIFEQLISRDKNNAWKHDLDSNNNMLRLLNEKNKILDSLLKLQTHVIKLNILKNNINILSANLANPVTIEALNQAKDNSQKYKDEYAELKSLIEKDGPDIAKSYLDPVDEKLNELSKTITNYKVIGSEDDLSPLPSDDDLVDLKSIIGDEPEGPKLAEDYIADWDNPEAARVDIQYKFEDAREAYENGEYAKAESEYHLCRLLIVGFKDKFPDNGLADFPDRRLEGERLLCSAMEASAAAQIEITKPDNTGIRNGDALQAIERAAGRAKLAVSELSGEDTGIWNPDDYTDQYEFELTNIKNLVAQAKNDQKDLLSQADKAAETHKLKALIDHFKNYRNPQSEFGAIDLNAKKDLHIEWEKFNNLRDVLLVRQDEIEQIRSGLEESERANGPNIKDINKRLNKLTQTEMLIIDALGELNEILKNIDRTRIPPSPEMDAISKEIKKAEIRQSIPGADQTKLKEEIEQLQIQYADEEKKWKNNLQDQLNNLEARPHLTADDEYKANQIRWTLNSNLTEETATEIVTVNREKCASEADYKSKVQAEIAKLTGSTITPELIALGSDLAVDKRKLVDLSKETVVMKIGKNGQETVFVKEEAKNKQDFSIAIHKVAPNADERKRHFAQIAEQYIAKNPPGQIRITGKDPEMVKEVKAYIDAMHDLVKDSKEKSKYERQPDTLGTLEKISHWRKVSAMKSLIEKDKTLSNIVNAKNLYQHKDSVIPFLGDRFETRVGASQDKDIVQKTTEDIRSNNRPK